MDFSGGGPPLNKSQDFGIQGIWLPATPVKDVPTRRVLNSRPNYNQRNQASEPTWLDLVTGVKTATPWGFSFQNEARNSISLSDRLQDLNGIPAVAEASGSQATIGCSITGRHNAGLMNCCSPKIAVNVLSAGSDSMPPLAPFFENCQVMPDPSNQQLLNGNVLFSQGSCNSSSNWDIQKTQYGPPVTFNPNPNSFPEATMSFARTGAVPSLLNPMILENYGQTRPDKHRTLENAAESFLMKELCGEISFSNLIASSEYDFYQKQDCIKNLAIQSDKISYQQIGIEKNLVEAENGVELNDASKQKSRRKKHRPKVIIEGRSARTPKPSTPKPKTPQPARDKENASGQRKKRKYTRRNKEATSFSETNDLGGIIESESRTGAKSVRRSLNFDSEESKNADKFSVLMSMFMKNLENPEQEACKNGNLTSSILKEADNATGLQDPHVDNRLEVPQSSMIESQNYIKNIQSPLWSTTVNHDVRSPVEIVNSNCISDAPPRGIKRDHYLRHEVAELETAYIMHSYKAGDCACRSHDPDGQGSFVAYSDKRIRLETGSDVSSTNNPSTGWRTMQASKYSEQFTYTETMKLMAQEKLQTLESLLLCKETDTHNCQALSNNASSLTGLIDYGRNSAPVKPSQQRNDNISQPPTPEKPSGYSNSQESRVCGRVLKFEMSEDVNKPVKAKGRRGRKRKEENPPVNPFPSTDSSLASTRHGEKLNHEVISFNGKDRRNCKASTNSCFPSVPPYMDFIDYIVHKLRRLSLNRDCEIASSQAQNAIVPYVGSGGMMVPYEGPFELAKRRHPRPKVDLDPETNRVWNLLMGIEGNGYEGAKVDKEKWWEEERRVFQGRVDSFIARMHLVQGDRRFSQWKGSVVDSVIGVFLTQNVSDHLSSSAYMALAAKFPLRSGGKCSTSNIEKIKMPMENHNECTKTLQDAHNARELERIILDHSFYSQASPEINVAKIEGKKENSSSNETLWCGSGSNVGYYTEKNESHEKDLNFGHDSPNSGSNTGVTVARSISSVDLENRKLVEEVISSHNSVVSSQSCIGYQFLLGDHIGSKSMLNVDTDDLLTGRMNNGFGCSSFTELLHIAESKKFQELYSHGSMSSVNSQVIHNIENRFSVLDKLDNSKGTYQTYQADFTPHHTAFGLSNMLPESQFFYSLSPSNFTILENNASTSQEEHGSSLLGNKFEVNHGECRESAAENLIATDSPNKLLSTSGSASAIDSYLPIRTESKEQPTFSETEVCIDHQSFSDKSAAEITDASSNIEHSNGCPCIQAEDMERLQQKKSTFEAEISQGAIKVQRHMDNKTTSMKTSTASNSQEQNKLDVDQTVGSNLKDKVNDFHKVSSETPKRVQKGRRKKADGGKTTFDWDSLRKEVNRKKPTIERGRTDSLDWEAVRCADVSEISETIRERGMNNMLAERIKDFLNRLVREHGSIDLEWLRDVPPDKSKDYLLSIRGLGLKSAECVRLLTLHHLAFPVDTNVGRICVRLGWVPLQPLPESLQLHLLELYPVLETIQKYLWPRLCKLDQRTLYELHYQMITFGKVFCTKSKPNCNACPMRGECRHFASAFASARLALPPPADKSIVSSTCSIDSEHRVAPAFISRSIPKLECSSDSQELTIQKSCEPIIEEPATPDPECQETLETAIEDAFFQDPDEIPTIKLNFEKFTQNLQNYMQENMELRDGDMSKALVALTPEAASIPMPKLKNVSRLRTEHQVYEIPDSHQLLEGLDQREPDDPCPYLLAIWTPGETAQSTEPPEDCCNSQDTGQICDRSTCFACNSIRESQTHMVRGTLLIPCRTAMRGSFPLNGTYFQVNEVFADHHSSRNPIDIPRDWIWNLPRRTVCFGTSIPTIFRGLTTEGIQQCFWRGFVCVRGFDQVTRAPKPLYARLHFPASKATKYRKSTMVAATATNEGEKGKNTSDLIGIHHYIRRNTDRQQWGKVGRKKAVNFNM